MMNIQNIQTQIINSFNHIEEKEPYRFFVKDKRLYGVTTKLSSLKHPFQTELVATNKVLKKRKLKTKINGSFIMLDDRILNLKEFLTKEDLLNIDRLKQEWKLKALLGQTKGNIIHDYIESLWLGNEFKEPSLTSIPDSYKEPLKEKIQCCKKHALSFYEEYKDRFILISSEFVIGDEDNGIMGLIDALFYDKKYNEIVLVDWKTDKQYRTNNFFKKYYKAPLDLLPECEQTKYSLQTTLYKDILSRKANLKIGRCMIVWFNEKNDNFQIKNPYDYSMFLNHIYNADNS